jgi:beta-glucosidase
MSQLTAVPPGRQPVRPQAVPIDEPGHVSCSSQMGLDEKVGQMSQLQAGGGWIPEHLAQSIREGRVGSVLNEVDVDTVNELQRIAVEESRLGIPLIFGRDVIHGFKTIFPIPLGQAASWNPALVEAGARVSALEAARYGVHWTFAPMIDITRDPRWGPHRRVPGRGSGAVQ